uniref:Syndecan/Neurexin domain-containing protein n=1 Tax=Angiostrongylus cantonensis TaxID=6313 RepID=A0A0K0DDB3_ANGCA
MAEFRFLDVMSIVLDHNTNTFSSSRGVIRAQVTPSHGPFTFPEHLRTRRLDDININPVNDESLTRATSSVSAIDVNQVVTNQMPLEAPEERNDQVHVLQITPQIIPRESPVAQPTPETQHTMKARALCSNPHLGYQRIVFLLAKYPTNTSKWQYVKNTTSYYSNEERAIHQAILAGGGGMTVLLALATFIYGGIGLNLMKSRLADEYEKEARLNAYENQAFQY